MHGLLQVPIASLPIQTQRLLFCIRCVVRQSTSKSYFLLFCFYSPSCFYSVREGLTKWKIHHLGLQSLDYSKKKYISTLPLLFLHILCVYIAQMKCYVWLKLIYFSWLLNNRNVSRYIDNHQVKDTKVFFAYFSTKMETTK